MVKCAIQHVHEAGAEPGLTFLLVTTSLHGTAVRHRNRRSIKQTGMLSVCKDRALTPNKCLHVMTTKASLWALSEK